MQHDHIVAGLDNRKMKIGIQLRLVRRIAFGMGGALLQKCDRDTLQFAMKANEIVQNGTRRDVYKDPVTDPGKVSKKGRQAVVYDDGELTAIRAQGRPEDVDNQLEVVYYNHERSRHTTLDEVRERAKVT